MPKTINKVELLGRAGVEPEMRYTSGGTAITQLRLATDASARVQRRRQDGAVEADWHTVTFWARLAEAVNEYVSKGDRLYVAGKLVQNSYQNEDGQWRHRTEVHASEVVIPSRSASSTLVMVVASPRSPKTLRRLPRRMPPFGSPSPLPSSHTAT